MYIKRTLDKQIKKIEGIFPVILITGPRQVGKTTILDNYRKSNKLDINYVTLDDRIQRNLAVNDPKLFLETHGTPLIIDEVQYAPELFSYIKIRVDKYRLDNINNKKKETLYYLTGSQVFNLMEDVSESLAGRVGIIDMFSLSYSEIINEESDFFLPEYEKIKAKETRERQDVNKVFATILKGGYPELYSIQNEQNEIFYSTYVRTYLERDVRKIINVRNESKFLTFMCAVAARTSQELNYSDIAKDIEIDLKTVESWFSILRTSGLVFVLQPFSNNQLKRIIKRPKFYFTDTGLACYLAGYADAKTLERSAYNGAIFENFIIMEIVKSFINDNKDPRLYLNYYRDKDGKEVDLIITINNIIYPIEIKKSSNPGIESIKNFNVFNNIKQEIGHGGVICMIEKVTPIDGKHNYIPYQCI